MVHSVATRIKSVNQSEITQFYFWQMIYLGSVRGANSMVTLSTPLAPINKPSDLAFSPVLSGTIGNVLDYYQEPISNLLFACHHYIHQSKRAYISLANLSQHE
jgi:hypothetical protein